MIPFKIGDINYLQIFSDSGEKTEKPTPKRREKAREEGQVARSQEMNNAILLLVTFFVLKFTGKNLYDGIRELSKKLFTTYVSNMDDVFTINGITELLVEVAKQLIFLLLPTFIVIIIAGLAVNIFQVGLALSSKALEPKLSRLNPMNGFKRMFSMKMLVELLKSILKISIMGYVVYTFLLDNSNNIPDLLNMSFQSLMVYIGAIITKMAITTSVVYLIIAIGDYLYQKFEFEKSLKMSKQEIKEEYKQTEGDPQIKSKIKQKQREIAMRRMLQDIPKADVVITNPTHFAVAIMYKAEQSTAPVVVAKGQDHMAQKIKEIAKDNNIQLMENKPLARALYSSTEIGQEIPPELYQAVAEVLAFVYSLKKR